MDEQEVEQFRSPEEEEAARSFNNREQIASVEQERKKPFDAVIVLGAGVDDPFWKRYNEAHPEATIPEDENEKNQGWMLGQDAKMRTIAAAEMYRQGLTSRIIFTGGHTATGRGIEESEAQKMKEYASFLLEKAGISREEIERAILLEDKATNTIENIANVCNMIDQDPKSFQNLAVLTNQYHVDRAQEILEKFNLKAEGINAEDLLKARSPKYERIVNNFFNSPGYQGKLAGEMRWTKGLKEMPAYWHPQAWAVEDPKRMEYLLSTFGLEQIAEKVGQKELTDFLKTVDRIPSVRYLQKIPNEQLQKEAKVGEPKKIKIFLARHGESAHNIAAEPYFAGGSLEQDAPLTEEGIESAKKVAERLRDEGVEVLVTSDLKRSRETGEIIAQELGYPVEIVEMEGLREVHVGELTGKTREEVRSQGSDEAKKALDAFLSGDIKQINFPGGESYESARRRVKEVFERIVKEHGDKAKIAIIGHGNINKVMLSLMFPDQDDFIRQIDLSHENIMELEMDVDKDGNPDFKNLQIHGEGRG